VTLAQGAPRPGVHYALALAWLIFTVSLASWWLAVGLSIPGLHRMFIYEGITLIVMLVAGGAVIVLAIRREHLRRRALETFFMSFTHDLKTSLASVQLQAEGLREDWPEAATRDPLDRLLHDTVRLQIQLENSLFVAQPDGRLLRERLDLGTSLGRVAQDWPNLTISATGNACVLADARAFDTVLRNLLQNAVLHGGADRVDVDAAHLHPGRVRLTIRDNGRGVPHEIMPRLGEPFGRAGRTGGTGVGLYVSRTLVARMGGAMHFESPASGRGLQVIIDLPGER
jgi:signal transduction histidine kinase